MVESILRAWIQHYINKHQFTYRGKKQVDYIIKVLQNNAEIRLKQNHGASYQSVCELLEKVAGKTITDSFKNLVKTSSPAGSQVTRETLIRISNVRHRLSHGIELPTGISPNLYELETDFEFLYENFIKKLDSVLPRK